MISIAAKNFDILNQFESYIIILHNYYSSIKLFSDLYLAIFLDRYFSKTILSVR